MMVSIIICNLAAEMLAETLKKIIIAWKLEKQYYYNVNLHSHSCSYKSNRLITDMTDIQKVCSSYQLPPPILAC